MASERPPLPGLLPPARQDAGVRLAAARRQDAEAVPALPAAHGLPQGASLLPQPLSLIPHPNPSPKPHDPNPNPNPNPSQEHPSSSPCYGVHGRKKCEGFQLDPADPCNVQYYLFCEQAPLSMHTFSMCLYVRPVHLVCTLSTLRVRILTLLPLLRAALQDGRAELVPLARGLPQALLLRRGPQGDGRRQGGDAAPLPRAGLPRHARLQIGKDLYSPARTSDSN